MSHNNKEIPWKIAVEILAMIKTKDLPRQFYNGTYMVYNVSKYLIDLRNRVNEGEGKRMLAAEIQHVNEAYYWNNREVQ